LPSFTKSAVCWQFCWQLQLGSSQLVDAQASKLEARVGIGRLMPCFQGKSKPLSTLFQYNLALFSLTAFNSLTEEFTEGFRMVFGADQRQFQYNPALFDVTCFNSVTPHRPRIAFHVRPDVVFIFRLPVARRA
jgi:hypothetical protein